MPDREKVINKVTAIVADMQEEVDEWKNYSDSELRGGLTCDCDWWYKTLQTLKDALALLKAQEPREMSDAELMDAIRKAPIMLKPAVDAAPVVHARWIDECCSNCGTYVYHGDADNYCPHCGAKMMEVEHGNRNHP